MSWALAIQALPGLTGLLIALGSVIGSVWHGQSVIAAKNAVIVARDEQIRSLRELMPEKMNSHVRATYEAYERELKAREDRMDQLRSQLESVPTSLDRGRIEIELASLESTVKVIHARLEATAHVLDGLHVMNLPATELSQRVQRTATSAEVRAISDRSEPGQQASLEPPGQVGQKGSLTSPPPTVGMHGPMSTNPGRQGDDTIDWESVIQELQAMADKELLSRSRKVKDMLAAAERSPTAILNAINQIPTVSLLFVDSSRLDALAQDMSDRVQQVRESWHKNVAGNSPKELGSDGPSQDRLLAPDLLPPVPAPSLSNTPSTSMAAE